VVAPAASAGRFLPRFLSSFLNDLIFFTALLSAALILFSSSESLATSVQCCNNIDSFYEYENVLFGEKLEHLILS
jgi:hypothetical protein